MVLFFTCLIWSVPPSASARFTGIGGSVGLGYHDYLKQEKGKTVKDGNNFSQRYSLSAGMAGSLYNDSAPYYLNVTYNYLEDLSKIKLQK